METVKENAKVRPEFRANGSGIVVHGIHDVAVRFSKCCSPVPGDEIVGFVTRGRGISIHRSDCINIASLPEYDRPRIIEAEWEGGEEVSARFLAEIIIYASNRTGLLADISRILTEKNISIVSLNTRLNKQGIATTDMAFEINNREELSKIIEKLRTIPSVLDIQRTKG